MPFFMIKVAISEFGLSKFMLILLNHYMFIEVTRYLHENKWFGIQQNKAKQAFLITLCYIVLFFMT